MIKVRASLPGRWTKELAVEMKQMPGGEMHPTVEDCGNNYTQFDITADTVSSDDLMRIALVVDAIRSLPGVMRPTIILHLGYVPYARQDRIGAVGEAHGSRVMANFINVIGVDRVYIADPHSDVITSLINNVRVTTQAELLEEFVMEEHCYGAFIDVSIKASEWIVVSPDAGAVKKTEAIAKKFGFKGIVYSSKYRDIKTGKITGTNIDRVVIDGKVVDNEALRDQKLLVVDDICDGGYTFIALAQELDNYGPARKELFVSHGIFSKGTGVLLQYFDRVRATNCFNSLPVTEFEEISEEELLARKVLIYPFLK